MALAPAVAFAAGGHHAVDDAALLDPNRCEIETWAVHARGSAPLLHSGLGCRIGAVEFSAAAETDSGGRAGFLQVKAAWPLTNALAFGASIAPYRRYGAVQEDGVAASLVASWTAGPWLIHANLGRDFGAGQAKSGVAVEWQANAAWSLLAERYTEQGMSFLRTGLRWLPARSWAVDFSHARALRSTSVSQWTWGATFDFAGF